MGYEIHQPAVHRGLCKDCPIDAFAEDLSDRGRVLFGRSKLGAGQKDT